MSEKVNAAAIFGENVFNDKVMQERLPKKVYKELKKRNCRNVFFFPLSISDKYVSGNINSKTIDVIQFGRKNRKLHEYMLRICKKNPDIEYIYQISGKH